MADRYSRTFCTPVLFSLLFLLSSGAGLFAQGLLSVENPFSSVFVTTDQKAGRFWFAAGAQHGYTRYLYRGAGISTSVTSNVVFRVERDGKTYYFCNTPENFGNGGVRPQGPQGAIPFVPYDSIRREGNRIEVLWNNVGGYAITMRFVAEPPAGHYDDGADILLEFDYRLTVPSSSARLGIFLMADCDNAGTSDGGGGEPPSVVASSGYFSPVARGRLFDPGSGAMPEFYFIGSFRYDPDSPGQFLPVHRLSGTSLGGAPLTMPDKFAVGGWKDFRSLSWDFNPDIALRTIGDAATAMRWENLTDSGTVRTAFGTTSRAGNNLHHGRDTGVFVALRTARLVRQKKLGDPYSPNEFDVEMWVVNTDPEKTTRPQFRLPEQFSFMPTGASQMRLDPSTPSLQNAVLLPGQVAKLRWRLIVDSVAADTLATISLLYRDSALGIADFRPLGDGGSFAISFRTPLSPVADTEPPVIVQTGAGPKSEWRGYDLYDRHAGFDYNTGINSIEVVRNPGDNIELVMLSGNYRRCDTTETFGIEFRVKDTTRPGDLLFRVYDCAGNTTLDSMKYRPRPDPYRPEVVRVDSIGRWNDAAYPCAVPVYEVYMEDRSHLTDSTADAGFGSINVLAAENFFLPEINFDRGGAPIEQFDPTLSFRVRVIDTLKEGFIAVRVYDFAGNMDTLFFDYCPVSGTTSVADDAVSGAALPAILSVRPQPFQAKSGGFLSVVLKNIGDDARLELVAPNGERVLREALKDEEKSGPINVRPALPGGLPSGAYLLLLHGKEGTAGTVILVTD